MLANEEVFGVVDVLVRAGLYAVDHSWFKIYQNSPRNVSCVVTLVEEDIFAIPTLGRKVFEISVLIDAMLLT